MTPTGDDPRAGEPMPTEPEPPAAPPADPAGPDVWEGLEQTTTLATWMVHNEAAFTAEALDRSALQAGYAPEMVAEARRRAHAQIHAADAIKPIRKTARLLVLELYVAVYVILGVALARQPATPGVLDFREDALPVLTVTLVIGLVASAVFLGFIQPDPDRPARALALLLAIPLLFLGGVAGLCLPFVIS